VRGVKEMSRPVKNNSTCDKLQLSHKQELLLSKFFDGECSLIGTLWAKRLLSSNTDAQKFLAQLHDVRDKCSQLTSPLAAAPVDLWERIATRIEQEEHAALYLGLRRLEQPRESLWQRLSIRHAMIGGASGAAIAAVLLTLVNSPSQLLTFSAPAAGPVVHNQFVQPVGIGSTAPIANRYAASPVRSHNPLEVDWMRANGSLKLIPDPNGASAIIWVRRRPADQPLKKPAPLLGPTPLGLALPDSGMPSARKHPIDERPQLGTK